jgi:PAS domain S-box-containing protein
MSSKGEFALRLKSIIDTAIDGIIVIDSKGIIDSINPAACRIFQYKNIELIGKNVSVLMTHPHRRAHNQYINNYLDTRVPKIIGIGREVIGRKKDTTKFPFRLAVSEVVLNDRIIFTGIIHDLTETKKAEQELKDLNNELEHKISRRTEQLEVAINRLLKTNKQLEASEHELKISLQKERDLNDLKSKFVSIASHEFRTPLSTILSSASLINRYELTEQQTNREKHIEKIKSAVNNLTGILNDFLDLSKLEEGKIVVQFAEIAFESLVNEIFSELEGIRKPEINFKSIIPQDYKIISDKRTLKNILFNLLSNAIKYSKKGLVQVEVFSENDSTIINIIDEGMGIPIEQQKHMFQRFFRASNVEGIQGTGLGLSIVKRYLDILKGNISFESQLNKGTTFTIKLPK